MVLVPKPRAMTAPAMSAHGPASSHARPLPDRRIGMGGNLSVARGGVSGLGRIHHRFVFNSRKRFGIENTLTV